MDKDITIIRENPRELNKFVSSKQDFVTKIARKFLGRGLELDDLVQEGNIGLWAAIKRYEKMDNVELNTYLFGYVSGYIRKALRHTPDTLNIDEVFKEEDNESNYSENNSLIAIEDNHDFLDNKETVYDIIYELFDSLTEKQQRVIQMLYGIDCNGGKAMAVKDIARKMNISQEAVRLLKSRALKTMREESSR